MSVCSVFLLSSIHCRVPIAIRNHGAWRPHFQHQARPGRQTTTDDGNKSGSAGRGDPSTRGNPAFYQLLG